MVECQGEMSNVRWPIFEGKRSHAEAFAVFMVSRVDQPLQRFASFSLLHLWGEKVRMRGQLEEALVYQCSGDTVYGILHHPDKLEITTGVVIVVGGPQYRVGSHRQFVELARGLAEQGIPVFRFDCRGMGDSSGEFPGFEDLDMDIQQAIDVFVKHRPELNKIVLWGLCDGASAACFYAPTDQRIAGLCLANPWVRTEEGEAEAFLKHYYLSRILSKAFWQKLFSGRFHLLKSAKGLLHNIKRSKGRDAIGKDTSEGVSLPVRLFNDLFRYQGRLMFVISGNDLTAAEFMDSVDKNKKRKKLLAASSSHFVSMKEADHTFSRKIWMDELIDETAKWVSLL